MTISEMRDKALHIRQSYNTSKLEVSEHTSGLEGLHESRMAIENVATIVSESAQAAQKRFAGVVAGVVTQSLNSVYPNNPYEFRLEFRECAGKTVVDTLLYRDGEPLDPLSSTGGGIWDVLAFSLRVALLVLTAQDDTRKLLVLDEPFKYLHGIEIQKRAYETMESVGKQFGITIFCVRQH